MRDALEEQLAARLRDVGDLVPAELEPPADLEAQVARAKKSVRGRKYGAALAVAAVFLAVVAIATVLDGRTGEDVPVAVAPVKDSLPKGTVMLGAKGRYVTARDATGKVLATMVTTSYGNVLDARVTADHKTIFYRVTDPASPCAKIARADIGGSTSRFVARGDAFAIRPDGEQLAVSGYGDFASQECAATGKVEFAILDLAGNTTVRRDTGPVYSDLLWDREGLVGRTCMSAAACGELATWRAVTVNGAGQALIDGTATLIESGPGGVYRVERPAAKTAGRWTITVTRDVLASVPSQLGEVPADWTVTDIVPTASAVFLRASAPGMKTPGLYRLAAGRPVLVNAADPGAASPVFPISSQDR